jgi:hypothetical protein
MNSIKILALLSVLAITTLACTITFNSEMQGASVGALETYEIEVPEPESGEETKVTLEFGFGELKLNPGSDGMLISGIATYNVAEFEPEIRVSDTRVKITQQVEEVNLIPIIGDDIMNIWDLELGNFPIELEIVAGGYQGDLELGGIPISELHIAEGAASTSLSFSQENPTKMDTLRYDTGASKATLTGLANANFSEMDFRSGAGDYRLDFSGELQQDAEVSIKSGLSSIVIVVPEGTPATLDFELGVANIDVGGDWRMTGGVYTLPGEGPELTITVEMGAGNLELQNR